MSFRNSFCSEYIYNQEDFESVYKRLSEYFNIHHFEVNQNKYIISGYIKGTWFPSALFDLKKCLDGLNTNDSIIFAVISEYDCGVEVDTCVLKDGVLSVVSRDLED